MSPASIIRSAVTRAFLQELAKERYGDMVKAVVDLSRKVMAVGAELHADEEQMLLADGSSQENLWGINIFPDRSDAEWIEFDSMINIRPRQNNRSRSVQDPALKEAIRVVVSSLVPS